MSIDAFRKALHERPLCQEERASLTPDELFVLALARRLDRLTDAESRKLKPADHRDLAAMGLIVSEAVEPEWAMSILPSPPCGGRLSDGRGPVSEAHPPVNSPTPSSIPPRI